MKNVVFAAVAAAVLCTASATAELYPFDLKKKAPKTFAVWARAVPAALREVEWLSQLQGTASPVMPVSLGGQIWSAFTVCEPHNCGDSRAVIFVSVRQDRAIAYVRLADGTSDTVSRIGSPTRTELACLLRYDKDPHLTRC
jgi:hypothetical protein